MTLKMKGWGSVQRLPSFPTSVVLDHLDLLVNLSFTRKHQILFYFHQAHLLVDVPEPQKSISMNFKRESCFVASKNS